MNTAIFIILLTAQVALYAKLAIPTYRKAFKESHENNHSMSVYRLITPAILAAAFFMVGLTLTGNGYTTIGWTCMIVGGIEGAISIGAGIHDSSICISRAG
jgi:hypothetical protein